jgi:hypothetical protein
VRKGHIQTQRALISRVLKDDVLQDDGVTHNSGRASNKKKEGGHPTVFAPC